MRKESRHAGLDGALRNTLTVILAGGQGTRLYPLTNHRAKPAVPFGGIYRIIDFTLSNCVNSTLRRILLLTQYKSFSLDRHLQQGWSFFRHEMGEFIIQLPPQQRMVRSWYEGTADAIFQNIYSLQEQRPDYTLILSGDHIYQMDYSRMVAAHLEKGAELTIGAIRVPVDDARRFGVMQVDENNRIIGFQEKPEHPKTLPGCDDICLASMGVYVFSTEVLVRRVLEDAKDRTSSHDFGKNVIPGMISRDKVFAYSMPGMGGQDPYWRDIGTLDSYWDASMDVLKTPPSVDLWSADWPLRTFQTQRPPAQLSGADGRSCSVSDSILSKGARATAAKVASTVLFPDTVVCAGAEVEESVIMNDVVVGEGARVRRAIIDKHVRIPAGETVGHDMEADRRRFTVTEGGIAVIPRGFEFVT